MKHEGEFNLFQIETSCKLFNSLNFRNFDELNHYIHRHLVDDGYAVAYLDYKVMVGTFQGQLSFYEGEIFEPKHLQRLRVFNHTCELFMWRTKPSNFRGRLRWDEEGEIMDVVDALQVLWGTKAENAGEGWVHIFEERGTSLILPFDLDRISVNDAQMRVKLKTRNYIQYNSLGQAGYVDCRFMDIIPPK